ncbi:MAG: division/cell wall cluster transcriptional repressor MraZ [Eubacterium sp.]|nr:division/cell wall cluster transcriptional repressor MraZ [Eubacterium sp.]
MKGEYKSTLDAKGRMNIPIKLREEIGDSFVISKTIGNSCIKVYSLDEWQKLVEKIRSMPSVQTQGIQRFLFGSAFDVTADKQGRISVPAALREYAKLTADVVVVGLEGGAEIWDKSEWARFNEVTNSEELLNQALELGI